MRRTNRGRAVVVAGIVAVAAVLGATGAWAADVFGPSGTVRVTPEHANQFGGTYESGAGSRTFTTRLGAPPGGGTGALELRTPSDGDKVQFGTGELAGPLERFTDSSYWSVRDPASTADPGRQPSFQIGVDINGGTLGPGELFLLTYAPPSAPAGRWTRHDLGDVRWCVTRQVGGADAYRAGCADGDRRTIRQVVAQNPGVSVLAAGVNQGGGDGGLVSAVDLIRVGSRTYDFEPGTD